MNALTFKLKIRPEYEVDISVLNAKRLAGKSKKQISAIKLQYGGKKTGISDLFSITGSDAENIHILNSNTKLTHIGSKMSRGHIYVDGDAGDFLGKGMQGGKIDVNGNAACWTASAMRGGKIEIAGNSGDFLAACDIGEQYGMNGGTIIVHGNTGCRTGERMRRGMIVIFGNTGDYCASQMLAGTIIILGKTGSYPGFGMKRGTIILAKQPRHMLATFRHCGLLKIEFLRLLFKQLALSCKSFEIFRGFGPEALRYAGDSSVAGMGEILILKNARLAK